MTKDYHLTQEQAVALAENYGNVNWIGEMVFNKEQLHAFTNAVLDEVLGEPVGKVVGVAEEGFPSMPWINFNTQAEDLSLGTKLYAPRREK